MAVSSPLVDPLAWRSCALILCLLRIGWIGGQSSLSCRSPDNRPGFCVNLQNCASLRQAVVVVQLEYATDLAAQIAYVQQSLCGYDIVIGGLLVCCTDGVVTAQTAFGIGGNADGLQFVESFTFGPLAVPTSSPATFAPIGMTSAFGTTGPSVVPTTTVLTSATTTTATSTATSTASSSPNGGLNFVAADGVCGVSNFTQTRVVGGMDARLNAYPWIAALAYQIETDPAAPMQYLCAGSLISQRHVLTSAHCVNERLMHVRLGEHDLSSDADGARPVNVPIDERLVHEAYVANLILNDVALLRLVTSVTITDQIRPICLPVDEPLRSADLTGYTPFLAGWGSNSYQQTPRPPGVLQEVQIPIISNADCQRDYRTLFPQQQFDSRVLCAGEGGRDACQGDSGGPLMMPQRLEQTGKFYYVLIGLVSYGYECARVEFPGVYTRVSAFLPWIQQRLV